MNKDLPAFPSATDADREYSKINKGMTLRDYFAGQVIAGLRVPLYGDSAETLAKCAYHTADAMLKERDATLKARSN